MYSGRQPVLQPCFSEQSPPSQLQASTKHASSQYSSPTQPSSQPGAQFCLSQSPPSS
jgi:hypothetical protein